MTEPAKRYFVCTYGNFDRDWDFLKDAIQENAYRLHLDARYPEALDQIGKGDIILLKNYCWVVAYGIATGPVAQDMENVWRYVVYVDRWRSFNPDKLDDGIHSYGIRGATLTGGSMSVVKQVTEKWAREKLDAFKTNVNNLYNEKPTCSNLPISKLLEMNLRIPSYQRGYCWRREQVVGMLDDIDEWVRATNAIIDDKPYHLGTVIIKSPCEDDDSTDVHYPSYDIIDGQQRLLTFALFGFAAQRLCNINFGAPILDSNISSSANQSKISAGYLLRSLNTIEDWIKSKGSLMSDQVKGMVEKMLKGVIVCLVHIPKGESEDLAYKFFDTTNSTGLRLSDYDLLKTHHLRYVPEANAEFVAARWNRISEENRHKELLHLLLYRLRHWCRRNRFSVNADDTPSKQLFKHFAVEISAFKGIYDIPQAPRIDSVVSGGMEFFSYAESYHAKLKEFHHIPCVKKLTDTLSFHSKGVLSCGIKAILFMFYCKFGEQYIREALYCIAYRVSILRNNPRVSIRDLSEKDLFADIVCMLDRTNKAGEFMAWCLHPKFHYEPIGKDRLTHKRYWQALGAFLRDLAEDQEFALKTQTKAITQRFASN